MNNRWIALLSIGFLAVVTIIFYWVTTNPIDLTPPSSHTNTTPLSEPTVTFVNPTKGAQVARVTIVEFSDFECEHCQSIQIALDASLRAFPDDVRLVWKNLPNPSSHPNAIPAAVAAHCADRQQKFWQYHDALFARQKFLSEDTYIQIASELKLDQDRFLSCLNKQDTGAIIQKDTEEGMALGIIATPTLYVGSQKLVGSVTAEELVGIIQIELQKNGL